MCIQVTPSNQSSSEGHKGGEYIVMENKKGGRIREERGRREREERGRREREEREEEREGGEGEEGGKEKRRGWRVGWRRIRGGRV